MSEKQQSVILKKDIAEQVIKRVETFKETGELKLPPDYSPENAIRSAMLVLSEAKDKNDKNVLEVCTKESISEALLKMVVWGLSPLKNQCYFIAYGNKLACVPDYSGNIIMAKRYAGLKYITANVVLDGDEFEFEIDTCTGRKKIVKHKQTLQALEKNIVKGAYAIIELSDGSTDCEVMSLSQIKAAWNQGAAKGAAPAHKNFPDQMAKKTVINRACKLLIRSSSDATLFSDDIDNETIDVAAETVATEIRENANKEIFDFPETESNIEEQQEDATHADNQDIDEPSF